MKSTAILFEDIMSYIKSCISAVVYVSGGAEYQAGISSVEHTAQGTVRVEAAIEKTGIKIEEVRLYGKNGHLWAKQNVDITLDSGDAGVIYRFEIDLKEA